MSLLSKARRKTNKSSMAEKECETSLVIRYNKRVAVDITSTTSFELELDLLQETRSP
jgi:hypothetical protein